MILDLLAPPLCWSCRAPARRGSALCRDCRRSLRFLGPGAPGAPGPGKAQPDESLPHTGRNSSRSGPIAPGAATPPGAPGAALPVWAAVAYEGSARALVRALKFHAATAVADEMAALMIASAPPSLLAGGPTLVPVPLHRARLRGRGFNQAERLAAAIGARTGLALNDCLSRSGADHSQVGRTRSARLRGPPGSVRATAPAPATGLLIDDVVTTGATLAACAAALRAAGANRVAAIAFARTEGR